MSDGTWEMGDGPVVSSSIYDGTTMDLRKAVERWASVEGWGEGSWGSATVVASPGGLLSLSLMEGVRVVRTIAAKGVSNPKGGVFVVDFGENVAGVVRMQVKGSAGTRIQLRHAEVLQVGG